jgi:Replication initiator protein A
MLISAYLIGLWVITGTEGVFRGAYMSAAIKGRSSRPILLRLFQKYGVSVERSEFAYFLEEADKIAGYSYGTDSLILRTFEVQVKSLAERISQDEVEAKARKIAQKRSERIASERSLVPVRLNNSRILMALPFFSPDKRERREAFEYRSPDGNISLTVIPAAICGAAKVWDGDVLMYALSKAVCAYLETNEFPRTIKFSAYEYLQQCGKNPKSGKNKADLKDRVQRLSLTQYICSLINPVTGKEKEGRTFKLCNARWINDEDGAVEKIEIEPSRELFDYFASKNDLLTLKQGLLLEAWKEDRSGIRKRLLVLVGVHLGEQKLWKVGLKTLQGMCGHNGPQKKFKEALKAVISSLPWKVEIQQNREKQDIVYFLSMTDDGDLEA